MIYYTSNASGTEQIWSVLPAGGKPVQVTNDPTHHYVFVQVCPSMPDTLCATRTLASATNSLDEMQTTDLVLITVRSGLVLPLVTAAKMGWKGLAHPGWSPDGREIVLQAVLPNSDHKIVTVSSSDPNTVNRELAYCPGWYGVISDPHWSPDGQNIAYFSRPNTGIGGIYRMSARDGSGVRLLRPDRPLASYGFDPRWSPSGDCLSFLEWRMSGGWFDWNLKLVAADGTWERAVIDDQWMASLGNWVDNDTLITHRGGFGWFNGTGIWTVRRDGSGVRRVVDTRAYEHTATSG